MSFLTEIVDKINQNTNQGVLINTAETQEKSSPTEVIIKPEILDLTNVKEGEGAKSYRPKTFDEYVGQEKAKARALCYIEGCNKYKEQYPNTFFSAPAGCGKTLFANILASMLNKKFVACTAGEIKSEQQLVDKIVECESGILFLDEAHRVSNKIGTFLLPILEEYKISGKKIKPFTCIFATTHKGNIAENLSALVQRFPLQIELENYKINELINIFKQYVSKQYQNENIEEDIFNLIAKNCRCTPRIGLSLLREYIYIKDWKQVQRNNNIVKDGLTERDFRVLEYIKNVNGAGQMTLAKFLRVEPKTYAHEVEPYLMNKELITVSNKRQLTNKGILLLQEFKNGN